MDDGHDSHKIRHKFFKCQTTALSFASWSASESEEESISNSGNSRAFEDVLTVLVSFDRDAIDIDSGRGGVTMTERVLGLAECSSSHI
jgi:hypothetical protein